MIFQINNRIEIIENIQTQGNSKLKDHLEKLDRHAVSLSKLDTQVNIANIKMREVEKKSTMYKFQIAEDLKEMKATQAKLEDMFKTVRTIESEKASTVVVNVIEKTVLQKVGQEEFSDFK